MCQITHQICHHEDGQITGRNICVLKGLEQCFSTAAARYRALESIIPCHKYLSFYFSKHFSLINILQWKYSEENNIRECVKKLRLRTPK
jgi:hypothetical protein